MNRHSVASVLMMAVLMSSVAHANSVQPSAASSNSNISKDKDKQSFLEKAISQQKRSDNDLSGFDLDMMNEGKSSSATQSFFAAQHVHFSRLLQALLNNPSS